MALRSEFVEFLAEKVAEGLVEGGYIDFPKDFSVKEKLFEALNAEVLVEDHLNDEVRVLLNEYSNQMRENGISYQEMFKMIKRKLARERKLVL